MDTIKAIDLFAKPSRKPNGQMLSGYSANLDGAPCKFCKNATKILKKIDLYDQYTQGRIDGKLHMPWIEQLCDEDYLDIDDETLIIWVRQPHDPQAHRLLSAKVRKLWMRQKYYLKVRGLQQKNAGFYQFLLERSHGMIPVQREIQSGDKDNPITNKLEIEVIEAKRHE